MGRAVHRTDAPLGEAEAEAALERRSRRVALRIGCTVMATDPPAHPEVREAVSKDLVRAQALPAGQERRDAIEAVGRLHYGDALIDSWIALPVRDVSAPFTDPRSSNNQPEDEQQ